MAFDEAGNLYVTEEEGVRVVRIAPDGSHVVFADAADGLMSPEAIAIHQGRVYVTDALAGGVFAFDRDGRGRRIVAFGPQFRNVEGIAVDATGTLYVGIRNPTPLPSYVLRIRPRRPAPATGGPR
jgi:sugar lactone lactonase YvrE